MAIITPTNKEVLNFQGLHLYHSGVSNCSMRVRMTLDEKRLPWTSHHLNILKKEHVTPEYFGINPNGLVPTLVHDGKVIIESDDIIDYLDKEFPNPALRPVNVQCLDTMYKWLHRATEIHLPAVKPYIYFKRVGASMALSEEEDKKYESLQSNPDLKAFHQKSTNEGFSKEDIESAVHILDECFSDMNSLLGSSSWLAGDEFSLADIAWAPLHFTLDKMAGYDFEPYKEVSDWMRRLRERDSYRTAIIDYWPAEMGGT